MLIVLFNNLSNFSINGARGCLTVVFDMAVISTEEHLSALFFSVSQRSKLVAHTPLTNHLAGNRCRSLQIIRSTTGNTLEDQFLGYPSTEKGADLNIQAYLGLVVLFLCGQVHGDPHSPATRN